MTFGIPTHRMVSYLITKPGKGKTDLNCSPQSKTFAVVEALYIVRANSNLASVQK